MEIEELKKRLSGLDMASASLLLEKSGFRLANPDYNWEYDQKLFSDAAADKTIEFEDEKAGAGYVTQFYYQIKGYEGITFVQLKELCLALGEAARSVPKRVALYTSAPINEEYERLLDSLVECDGCKRKYKKKELTDWFGENYCAGCLWAVALGRRVRRKRKGTDNLKG